jgi:hypothetical protein
MGTKGLILFTLFLLIIFSTSFVYAYEEFEHTIFIIDENTNLTYRYQYEIQVTDYGMYLPAFTTELYVPSEAQNLTFFDNYGKVNAKKLIVKMVGMFMRLEQKMLSIMKNMPLDLNIN